MLKTWTTSFLDLLYPKTCHACSRLMRPPVAAFDDFLCWSCFSSLKKMPPAELPDNGQRHPFQRLIGCYAYEGATKQLIRQFKYENRPYLARTISALICHSLENYAQAFFRDIDIVLPVPLHPARQREREFNQAELIADDLCRLFHKPLARSVRRKRNTQPQSRLTAGRFKNVRGAFRLTDATAVTGRHVLVVDDVVTSSATVSEIAGLLRQAGTRRVSVLTFAQG